MIPRKRSLTGVYKIVHKRSGKLYIGSSSLCLRARMTHHHVRLYRESHGNQHLQSAWKKYGPRAFVFAVVEYCLPRDCLKREQHWIDITKCADRRFGYNKSPNATSVAGTSWSAESRARMSRAHQGRKLSPESIAKRTAKQTGIKRTEKTKRLMSEVAKRRGISSATRVKMETTKRKNREMKRALSDSKG